jgi:hypothetical protein
VDTVSVQDLFHHWVLPARIAGLASSPDVQVLVKSRPCNDGMEAVPTPVWCNTGDGEQHPRPRLSNERPSDLGSSSSSLATCRRVMFLSYLLPRRRTSIYFSGKVSLSPANIEDHDTT